MTNISRALAVSLLSSAFFLTAAGAYAQSNATPPSTSQTTGQHNPDPKVREMNQKAKDKVEREGK